MIVFPHSALARGPSDGRAAALLADVFATRRTSIVRSVMRIVRDAQAAEDVAQETYLRTREALERGPIQHIEAYLYRTARNLAINHRRRLNARQRVERDDVPESRLANMASPALSQEDGLLHRQRLRCLDEAVAKLPERARTVWLLSRVEKWPYPRIAQHLGVSPNTVFNDLKRAHAECIEALAKLDRG